MKQYLKILAKLAVIVLIVYFLTASVLKNWEAVKGYDWSFNPSIMVCACAVFCLAYVFLPFIWQRLLFYMGYPLSFSSAWEIFYIGSLGRYIPGKVWTIAGMAYLAEKKGVPGSAAAASAVLANVYSLLSSFVFFVIFFIFREPSTLSGYVLLFVPVFGIALVFFVFPRNLERALNILLKLIGRNSLNIGISTVSAVKTIALYALSGGIFAFAFWLFVSAFVGMGVVNPLYTGSAYIIAYWAGYLAFFVPGGIGVREGMLGFLFLNIIPASVLIIIAALVRLLVTLIEIVYVTGILFRKGLVYGKEKKAA